MSNEKLEDIIEEHDHECHDENCSCHHDHEHHDHEHHHDHDHDEHEHNHNFELELSTHDMSTIASYTIRLKKPNPCDCKKFLSKLGEETEALGGIIGHIKAVYHHASKGIMYSVTYDDVVNSTPVEDDFGILEGVCIVFNVSEEDLEHLVEETYEAIFG